MFMITLFVFALTHFLAIISPGPVLIRIFSISVSSSFKKCVLFILGVSIGDLLILIFSLLGLIDVIFKSLYLSVSFYLLGGLYFCFLGFLLFKTKNLEITFSNVQSYFLNGFMISILNPKAYLFSMSLLSLILNESSSIEFKSLIVLWLIFVGFLYEVSIAYFFVKFKNQVFSYLKWVMKFLGVFLVIFGFNLLWLGYKQIT